MHMILPPGTPRISHSAAGGLTSTSHALNTTEFHQPGYPVTANLPLTTTGRFPQFLLPICPPIINPEQIQTAGIIRVSEFMCRGSLMSCFVQIIRTWRNSIVMLAQNSAHLPGGICVPMGIEKSDDYFPWRLSLSLGKKPKQVSKSHSLPAGVGFLYKGVSVQWLYRLLWRLGQLCALRTQLRSVDSLMPSKPPTFRRVAELLSPSVSRCSKCILTMRLWVSSS